MPELVRRPGMPELRRLAMPAPGPRQAQENFEHAPLAHREQAASPVWTGVVVAITTVFRAYGGCTRVVVVLRPNRALRTTTTLVESFAAVATPAIPTTSLVETGWCCDSACQQSAEWQRRVRGLVARRRRPLVVGAAGHASRGVAEARQATGRPTLRRRAGRTRTMPTVEDLQRRGASWLPSDHGAGSADASSANSLGSTDSMRSRMTAQA